MLKPNVRERGSSLPFPQDSCEQIEAAPPASSILLWPVPARPTPIGGKPWYQPMAPSLHARERQPRRNLPSRAYASQDSSCSPFALSLSIQRLLEVFRHRRSCDLVRGWRRCGQGRGSGAPADQVLPSGFRTASSARACAACMLPCQPQPSPASSSSQRDVCHPEQSARESKCTRVGPKSRNPECPAQPATHCLPRYPNRERDRSRC